MRRIFSDKRSACLAWLVVVFAASLRAAEPELSQQPAARHPVAAVSLPDGLLVLNEQSHSVSRVDIPAARVLWEQSIGESPVAIVPVPGSAAGKTFVVVDHAAHQLISVRLEESGLTELSRTDVIRWPVSAVSVPSGELAIAGLWSRRLEILSPAPHADGRFVSAAVLPVPFNPRLLLPIGAGKLLVADGFGGRLAVVDLPSRSIVSIRSIQGHNIRGMTLDPQGRSLYLTHQMLDERAATTHDNVSLGILMSNLVRQIPVTALLDPHASLETESRRFFLGRTLEGAADPHGLTFDSAGKLWVALGGTSELCEVSAEGVEIRRLKTGPRPTAVRSVGHQIAVLETLGDGVAVVDPSTEPPNVRSIPLGPPRSLTRAERGERLFANGTLSLESWMSCQSCHPDGHTQGLLADTAGDGGFGNPKRTLSLLGTRDANPWAWNGQFRELGEQIHKSVTSSMQGRDISLEQGVDIVTFLHTLRPAPPVDEPQNEADRSRIERGRTLFGTLRCSECHIPPLTYTTDGVFDVGLHDERGQQKFNPPTLRGVSQRDRLFHDRRAGSLEAVFDEFGHQLPRPLTTPERDDLLRFLRSL